MQTCILMDPFSEKLLIIIILSIFTYVKEGNIPGEDKTQPCQFVATVPSFCYPSNLKDSKLNLNLSTLVCW